MPESPASPDLPLSPAAAAWFALNFREPTPVQRGGWERIAGGENALLLAPTGSGKTLAAFLYGIDRLVTRAEAPREPGARIVYVSPLKALVYDIERNLRAPLAGVLRTAERLGLAGRPIDVDVRTGDTPSKERQRQARQPAEILVTTPESLYLMLGSRARAGFTGVEVVIVDEVHAMAGTKRGAHLAVTLERIEELAGGPVQRIGLSATVREPEEVARFLGGDRPVAVVDTSAPPDLDLEVVVPLEDLRRPDAVRPRRGGPLLGQLEDAEEERADRGVWAALVPPLLAEVEAHRSTILFVPGRATAERLTVRLNEASEEELAHAHHGSVSHEKRAIVEDRLKRGELRAICATSSLELGIDMGAVDSVCLCESPGSVASGLQRVGRAGHGVGVRSRGRLFPKTHADLLESSVIAERMLRGDLERVRTPRNPLDVLSQQVVALCLDKPRSPAEIGALVRRSHPFRELSERALDGVLEMLAGKLPASSQAELRPRLAWDRARDLLTPRRGAELVARFGAGTIPDRGTYPVVLGVDGPRVGELDEEMVFESREGDTFLLGSSTWRIEEIERDRIVVSPAPGEPGRMPFWRGEGPGRPPELGLAIGAFLREAADHEGDLVPWLRERAPLDELAARNLATYLREQREATGVLPSDRALVIERFRDELGDWRVCLHAPHGRRVLAPLALALEERLDESGEGVFSLHVTDDGLVFRFGGAEELPDLAALFPGPLEVQDLVTRRLEGTAIFASLFRENAVRSLVVGRRRPGQRNPLWMQRMRSRALLAAAREHAEFPLVLETYRQALADVFDLDALRALLTGVREGRVAIHETITERASPFAGHLVFSFVAAYLYDADSPAAERRAQALTLDRDRLAELIGGPELRDLLDPEAVREVEAELSGLAEDRRAREPSELEDLLRRLGDLDRGEIAERCADPAGAEAWLKELCDQRRAIPLRIAGAERFVASGDAGLFRDALGVAPPGGLPISALATVDDALTGLLLLFARTRGPFRAEEFGERYGLTAGQVAPVLREQVRAGTLVEGALRPSGTEVEWCDREVLRRIQRRSLTRARGEAAPVGADGLGRFLVRWQGVERAEAAPNATLLEAIERLEGVPLPWSDWALEVLPARVPGFRLEDLDLLCARGELVWLGRGALGARDGRVVLCPREHLSDWARSTDEEEGHSDVERAVLDLLEQRGACFTTELERVVREVQPGLSGREVEGVLTSLALRGHLGNDTFGPLRALAGGTRRGRGRGASRGAFAGGRWWTVASWSDGERTATEAALARSRAVLNRYGIAGREAFGAEEPPGGFGPHARVLRVLEEQGRCQRGWFVEGWQGLQFAAHGAVDRLRAAARRDAGQGLRAHVLCACDPAQPHGALVPWPALPAGATRVARAAGALVVLVEGRAALYLSAGRKHLTVFADAEPDVVRAGLAALAAHPRRGRRRIDLLKINGVPAVDFERPELFEDSGFARDHRGYSPLG